MTAYTVAYQLDTNQGIVAEAAQTKDVEAGSARKAANLVRRQLSGAAYPVIILGVSTRRYILVKAADYGMDPAGGPWVCFCKVHSTLCNFESRALARSHLPYGEWCEACQEEASKR